MYNYQANIDSLNQRINEMQRLRDSYQVLPPQPIQNIINTNQTQPQFEARFLKKDENVEDLLVQHKTAFISPENGFLKIKDIDGTITEYQLIPPKDEKDLKIEELERKLKEYEQSTKSVSKRKSTEDVGEPDKE